ncbi:sigma factor-like helix-turn-helix DNA-binding protein [Archangium sp.]|uniref:sigma factor-like helix-turn-helix DNA-binding protein n=1 Tax=Archangium sp. TaxID=1872627 RepID=UPI00286C5629|nr:sigma factor-like helix-turn-helix DNA-binding protein [Archangium sp.]
MPQSKTKARFVDLLLQAQAEVLDERKRRMFEMRYGLSDKKQHTLADVGTHFNISRERVRQLVGKSLQRVARTTRSSRSGTTRVACGQLHAFLSAALRPEEPSFPDRLLDFLAVELPHLSRNDTALEFVLGLLDGGRHRGLLGVAQEAARARDEAEREKQRAQRERSRLDWRQERRRQRMEKLLQSVVWPSSKRRMDRWEHPRRAREINPDSEGQSGTFDSKKLGRPVAYESRLERRFFLLLEHLEEVEWYQEQPFAVPYELDGVPRTYYPDVLFNLRDGRGVVVEVKPTLYMARHENVCKWKGLQAFCQERGLGMLVTDGSRTLRDLERLRVPATFERRLLSALEGGPLSWSTIVRLRTSDVPSLALEAVVLQRGLVLRMNPFELQLAEGAPVPQRQPG